MTKTQAEGLPPLPCIVCGEVPELAFLLAPSDDGLPAQPYGATTFFAYGQYGSTVFDREDGSQLYVNICDKCLIVRAGPDYGQVWHVRRVRQPALTTFSRPFDPGSEDHE